MIRIPLIIFLGTILSFGQFKGWNPTKEWKAEGKMMGRERVGLVTINPNMTLAYDLNRGGLFLVWKGEIGTPQKLSDSSSLYFPNGPLYHSNVKENYWQLFVGDVELKSEIKGGHYKVEKKLLSLYYEIHVKGHKPIKIKETPKFDDHYGNFSVYRLFEVSGLPKAATLRLQLHGPQAVEEWQEAGGNGSIKEHQTKPYLIFNRDGETNVKGTWYFQ